MRMKTRKGWKEDSAMDTLVVKGTYAEEFDPLVAKNRYSVERERSEESSQCVEVIKLVFLDLVTIKRGSSTAVLASWSRDL